MVTTQTPPTPPITPVKSYGPTTTDFIFLAFLVVMLGIMLFIGRITYIEGLKTEASKSNGEAWVEWFKKTSPERFKPEFQPSACGGGGKATTPMDAITPAAAQAAPAASVEVLPRMVSPVPVAAAAEIVGAATQQGLVLDPSAPQSPAANTWGNCVKSLMAKGPLAELRNPFTGKRPEFVEKCDLSNRKLAGGLVLEKLTPTLPGMAIPVIASQLVDADVLTQRLQIRVTVCDKGGYPILIGSTDF